MNKTQQPKIPSEVANYYKEFPEEDRLKHGPSQLEFSRTQEVILRYLPDPPEVILDVGAAAGAYSLWLARKGYQVNLVDPVPHLVDEVPLQSDGSKHQFSTCQVGDARKLEFEDCSANGVLLLGPQQKKGSKQLILPFSN